MRRWLFVAIGAFTAAGFVASASADNITLRFGQIPSTAKSIGVLPFVIGDRQGFFEREGISLSLVPIAGGTDKMVKALDRGDVEITETATPYFVQAVLAGSNDVAVAAETHNPIYSLMVRPEIKSFRDIKGKTLGLSLAVDTISISMQKLLALKGLNASDFTVKELVGTPARFDCLKRGECDGVPLGQPEDFNALNQGYRRLGVSTEAVRHLEFTLTAVRRDWAQGHQDQLVRFLRAFSAAFRFIHAPANRDTVAKIIVEATGTSEENARAILALYFNPDRGVIPRAGEIDTRGFAQVIAFMGEAGVLKGKLPVPERFFDQRYLRLAGVR